MDISPHTEHALIDLARRGLWLKVNDDRLQVIATREDALPLTDELRAILARQRDELLRVVPALESNRIDLVGPIVRVLFERLDDENQRLAKQMRDHGNRRAENDWFYTNYSSLTIEQKLIYLWAFVYQPATTLASPKGVAA